MKITKLGALLVATVVVGIVALGLYAWERSNNVPATPSQSFVPPPQCTQIEYGRIPGGVLEPPGDWCIRVPAGMVLTVEPLGITEFIAKTPMTIQYLDPKGVVATFDLGVGQNGCNGLKLAWNRVKITVPGGGEVRVRILRQGETRLTAC